MIPNAIRSRIEDRMHAVAHDRFPGRFRELGVKFRGQFCFVDVVPNLEAPLHLLRLRYFGNPDRWSFAVYRDAIEDYEPAAFPDGNVAGPPEVALELVLKSHLD